MLLIGIVMSMLCGWINLQIGPQCRAAYKTMIFEYGLERASALIQEKGYTDFPGYRVYVDRVDGNSLHDVTIYQYDESQKLRMRMNAEQAALEVNPDTQQIMLTLKTVDGFEFNEGKERTFVYSKYGPMALGEEKINTQRSAKLKEMSFSELRRRIAEAKQHGTDATPARVQLPKDRLSFACIGFTLIGIPLAIRGNRRGTNIGIAFALGLVAIYGLIILAQALESSPPSRHTSGCGCPTSCSRHRLRAALEDEPGDIVSSLKFEV